MLEESGPENHAQRGRPERTEPSVPEDFPRPARWIPWIIGITIAAVTLMAWHGLLRQESFHLDQSTEMVAAGVKNEIAARMEARILALVRMANRMKQFERIRKEDWESDANLYVAHYPGYQAVAWVDSSFYVRWLTPLKGNEAARNLDLRFEEHRRVALEAARDRREVAVTQPINLVVGGRGFLAAVPIYRDTKFGGFILGAFLFNELLDSILHEGIAPGCAIAIFYNDEEVYDNRRGSRDGYDEKRARESSFTFYGMTWRVRATPNPDMSVGTKSFLPEAILIGGILLAGLLGFVTHLTQRSRIDLRKRELTNQKMTLEIKRRKLVEVELVRSLSLLRATLESTADGILVVDPEGRIVSFNKQFAKMWRLPESVLSSKDDNQALAFVLDQLKTPDVFLTKVRDLYSNPDQESFDSLEFKDGRIFERFSRPEWMDGSVVGRVWSFRDVTECKRLERVKEEFIGMIAHELRTPVTVIKGSITGLESGMYGPVTEVQAPVIDRISRNSSRLEKIIMNFLDLSHMESGKLQLHVRSLNLVPLIQDTVQNFRAGAVALNIILAESLPADLPPVQADGDMFVQVLTNLLSNALRYARDKVAIQAKHEAKSIWISVIDDGPGIPEEYRTAIFDKFRQIARPSGGGGYKGTGLGLAICKEIIEAHHGSIWVDSTLDRGSQFHFVLPLTGPDLRLGAGV